MTLSRQKSRIGSVLLQLSSPGYFQCVAASNSYLVSVAGMNCILPLSLGHIWPDKAQTGVNDSVSAAFLGSDNLSNAWRLSEVLNRNYTALTKGPSRILR